MMSADAIQHPDSLEGVYSETDRGDRSDVSGAGQPQRPWCFRLNRCGLAFALISLLFGGVFALVTPPLWGLDEFRHFARAYAIDHGRILPQQIPNPSGVDYGGPVPSTVDTLFWYAVDNFSDPPPPPAPSIPDPGAYDRLTAQPLQAPQVNASFTNTYFPVAYIPSVIGLRLAETSDGSVGTTITIMRVCNLLAYTTIVWLALWTLRKHRFKWVVLVVALLPMAVFQASTITADSVTNALAILFSALFIKATFLRKQLSRPETLLLFTSTVLLPLAKPGYVAMALLALFVPSARLALWRGWKILAVTAGLVGYGIWRAVAAKTSSAAHIWPGKVVDSGLQMEFVLTHPFEFLQIIGRTFVYLGNSYFTQFFGVFGSTFVPAPTIAVISCIMAGIIACGMAGRMQSSRTQLAAVITVVLFTLAAIFGTLYLEYSPVGHYRIEGVQGRYFIPLVVMSIAVLVQLIPLRLHLPTRRILQGTKVAVVALMFTALATSVLEYGYLIWH